MPDAGCRMPDAAQAVNRLPPALIPQERLHHGFDIIYTLSTPHQRFTFVRLFDPYLIGSCPTFSHLAHHHVS
ncbi:transposase (fragment) [Xenorhabdus nematophila ATCC 19061]|uniref:Transposase n=1 Tax=Xenorhabdus nematophila (strain ATCC 19061 / DSM 3370 / CCUG 14189 / LMG 1036 / NCIMB 9965 / AN6) TaxID=406817 RepID=D3VD02_XENNA